MFMLHCMGVFIESFAVLQEIGNVDMLLTDDR